MGRDNSRRIVVEYDMKEKRDKVRGERRLNPEVKRIISWRKEDGVMKWKQLKCPQNTFYGIKGYYGTLGLSVLFYNRNRKRMEKTLPTSVNL